MSKIEFFFDVSSPYTYLSASRIDSVVEQAGYEVEWKPFLLGGVFKATGNDLPAALPPRAAFMFKDLNRLADHYGVEFNFPADTFPLNSLLAQRVLTALYGEDQAAMKRLAREFFSQYWVHGVDLSKPEAVAETADKVGLDGADLVERASDPTVKDALRELTDDAVARGAFGAPTFFHDGEIYFGNDRLEHIFW